jgi:hypothetical protein
MNVKLADSTLDHAASGTACSRARLKACTNRANMVRSAWSLAAATWGVRSGG